jgi:hypothetical protein
MGRGPEASASGHYVRKERSGQNRKISGLGKDVAKRRLGIARHLHEFPPDAALSICTDGIGSQVVLRIALMPQSVLQA